MLHIIALQALVVCFIANLELCSNTTNIIMSCCEATYAIMRREPIGVSHLIDRSIKRMIDTIDRWLGHPYVITKLCKRAKLPLEDTDHLVSTKALISATLFTSAKRAAIAQQAQPTPPPQHHQHQH
jgi:hypothetical protein